MALAKKCDRCGKLYEHQSGVFNSISICRRGLSGTIDYTGPVIDMCPNCMALFEKFMKDGKELFDGYNWSNEKENKDEH